MPQTLIKSTLLIGAVAGLLGLSFEARAEQAPPQNPSDDAGIIEKKVREESLREILEIEEEKSKIEPAPEEPGPETRFLIRHIRVEGSETLSPEEIDAVTAPFINKELTYKELNDIALFVSDAARKKGRIVAVYFPPQRIENETVILKVVETRLGEVVIDGNRYFETRIMEKYLTGLETESHKIDRHALERAIERMNRHPDRKVRAVLKPAKETGATDIIFSVTEKKPSHLVLSIDNRGSHATGKERYGILYSNTNVSGHEDQLMGTALFGEDFGVVLTEYSFPFPQIQIVSTTRFSAAQALPQRDSAPFGVNGISQTIYQNFEKEIYNEGTLFGFFDLGVESKDSRTKVLSETFRRDRIRSLHFGPRIRNSDDSSSTAWNQRVSYGVEEWGSRIHVDGSGARQGVEPDFVIYRTDLARFQRAFLTHFLLVKAEFQTSSAKLPPLEQMGLGGGDSVRGYPESDYLADTALLLNLEYTIPLIKGWNAVLFFDEGAGKIRGPSELEIRRRHLMGIGGGLRIEFKEWTIKSDLGFAIGDHPLTDTHRYQTYITASYEA